jgi:hypothetical protein
MKKINWKDAPTEQENDKMKRQMVYGEKIMIARMEFADGFTVPWHDYENEQITEVQEGIERPLVWKDSSALIHSGAKELK